MSDPLEKLVDLLTPPQPASQSTPQRRSIGQTRFEREQDEFARDYCLRMGRYQRDNFFQWCQENGYDPDLGRVVAEAEEDK